VEFPVQVTPLRGVVRRDRGTLGKEEVLFFLFFSLLLIFSLFFFFSYFKAEACVLFNVGDAKGKDQQRARLARLPKCVPGEKPKIRFAGDSRGNRIGL